MHVLTAAHLSVSIQKYNCIPHRHLAMVLVLQSKIVSLGQVEMDTDQVKQHFAHGTLLRENNRGGK